MEAELADKALVQLQECVRDYSDFSYGIGREIRWERVLRSLPPESLSKLKIIATLKFLFAAVLIAEVVVLQR
jgi:hypothetical protein